MVGSSSFGRGFNVTFPILPEIRPGRTDTCQCRIIIEGERDCVSYIEVDNALIPLINYMDSKKWFVAAALMQGLNHVEIRSYDNIYHLISDAVSYDITRRLADFSNQGKRYKVVANGVDYSNFIKDFNCDSDNKFVTSKATLTMIGNFLNNADFDYDKTITVSTNDGFLPNFEKEFEGKIESKEFSFKSMGAKETKLTLLNEAINGLEKTSTINIGEIYNGQVQKGLMARIGINDIWTFNRYKYTGQRNLNDVKILDIIRDIAIVEGEIIDFDEKGSINFIPDEYLIYPLFEFDESVIQELSVEQSKSNLINKINVVYGVPDKNGASKGTDSNSSIDEPVTDAGYGFYADESMKNQITKLPRTGNVTFAAWNKRLDYELMTDSYVELFHTNPDFNLVNLKYIYPLEVVVDKKIVFVELPLGRLNLNKNSIINMNVVLSDEAETLYNPNITIPVEDTAQAINIMVNSFDAMFTKETEIASLDIRLSHTKLEDVEVLDSSNPNIEYINEKFEGGKAIYEFLYKIPVDDVILSSINFNLLPINNDSAHILNGNIVTETNADISGNNYIRAVTYSTPKTAYNRIKALYILFRTLPFSTADKITIKFKVFGKKFLDTGNFIDYGNLSYVAADQASIDKYGLLDGGYLISNYLTTPEQTEKLAKKIVGFYSLPITKLKLKLPLLSELRKNITIKVISPSTGLNYYYFINAVNKKFQNCEAETFLMRVTKIKRIQGIDSEYEIYSRNMRDMELSPFFNNIFSSRGLENGIVTVSHQDGSCDCKVFGSNKKYMRIPVIPKLKVKKDDKVLIATSIDSTKIVIAILDEKVEEIPEKKSGKSKEKEDFINGPYIKFLAISPNVTPRIKIGKNRPKALRRASL